MSNWSHGYNVSQGYTYDFFRELSPTWISWAAQINGAFGAIPGGSRYLELGCGQGVGLVILAACYPKMQFVGVDFNPAHIAHARMLAESSQLKNIEFVEADFNTLAAEWPAKWSKFDYVVLHGICSWVPESVRQSIVRCLEKAVESGGLVYVSYNSQPGWVSSAPMQYLLRRYQEATGKKGIEALRGGREMMQTLLNNGATMGVALPFLIKRLDSLDVGDPSYLIHEYLHDNWNIFWFSQIANEMSEAKLKFIASATLTDNFRLNMLPDRLTSEIMKSSDENLKEELLDVCMNQSFRRDIYQRGDFKPWKLNAKDNIENIKLTYLQSPKGDSWTFSFATGKIDVDMKLYKPLLDRLREGDATILDIYELKELSAYQLGDIQLAIAILAEHSFISCCRDANQEEIMSAQNLNIVFARAVAQGAPYSTMACASLGGGVKISAINWLMLDNLTENDGQYGGEKGLISRLKRLEVSLIKNEQALTDIGVIEQEVSTMWSTFKNKTLPQYRKWGAWL